MSRSRIAASLFLSLFLSAAPAYAEATIASKTSFTESCKAGHTYLIVSSATGASVWESQRVDCTTRDRTGALVNANARECKEQVGDIYWNCRGDTILGSYENCEHKTCKQGEAALGAAAFAPTPGTSAPTTLPPSPQGERGTSLLPPLSRQSILDALQEAPANLGQENVYRSNAADSFERLMLEAGLAPGGLVPGTGNLDASAPLLQTPSANDAVRLQGGTFSDVPMSEVPTSQETGGTGGPNTFAPTQPTQFAPEERPATWEDRVSAFLGCTVGYFFGGCDAAQAEPRDSDIRRLNITVLSVKPNRAEELPSELLSQTPVSREEFEAVPASAPIPQTTRSTADLDTMSPERLKAIEVELSAQRSAQAAEEEARKKAAIPKSPTTLQNNIFAGLFKALGGGGTEDLKSAWQEAARARSDAERAVPVASVEVAELPPIPGTEPHAAPVLAQPGTEPTAPQTAAPPQTFTVDAKVDAQVREAFETQKQSAQSQIRYFEDLLTRSGTTVSEVAAQGGLDLSKARLEAIEAEEKMYNARTPSPTLRSAIEQLQNGDGEGAWAKSFTSFAGSAHQLSAQTSKEMQQVWNNPAEAIGGLADTAIVLGSGYAGGAAEGIRNLAGMAGVPGFESDPNRALVDAIDPYKKYGQTALDAANVTPIGYAVYSVGKTGLVAVLDMMSPGAGLVSRELGLASELSPVGARAAGTDLGGTGAAVAETPVARLSSVAHIEPVDIAPAPGVASPFDKVTSAIRDVVESPGEKSASGSRLPSAATLEPLETPVPGPKLLPAANIEPAGAPPTTGPYAALDDSVAEARAAAARSTEPSVTPSAAETPVSTAAAAEDAAQTSLGAGLRADVSAWPRAAQPEVDKLSLKDWTGGAGITAGILCFGFCPSSGPLPQEPIRAEIVPLSKEDLALLFPQQDTIRQTSAPPEAIPVEIVIDRTPVLAQPGTAPVERETPIPIQQPATSLVPPAVAPPVLTAPPRVDENDLVIPPARTGWPPQPGTPEFQTYFEEQQRNIEAQIEAQRKKNQEALEAWDEAQRQRTKEVQEQIARFEKERVDMELPSPTLVSPEAQPVITPGTQGVGPLSSDDIAQGLLQNPANEGSRRKDLEINFEFGSAKLTKDGREQVAALAQVMSRDEFRNSTFTIVGHTDTVGTAQSNLALSQQRAQAIVAVLYRDYGIPLDQMKASGAGQWALKVPILGNVAANRRVEIVVAPRR